MLHVTVFILGFQIWGELRSLGVKTANELITKKRFVLKYHHLESELQSCSQ